MRHKRGFYDSLFANNFKMSLYCTRKKRLMIISNKYLIWIVVVFYFLGNGKVPFRTREVQLGFFEGSKKPAERSMALNPFLFSNGLWRRKMPMRNHRLDVGKKKKCWRWFPLALTWNFSFGSRLMIEVGGAARGSTHQSECRAWS